MFISPFMAIDSELIQIIVAAIYAITLFYTIVTFQRSKRVDQITSLGDVMNELRDVDRELEKMPSGSQFDDASICPTFLKYKVTGNRRRLNVNTSWNENR
jgi:hypothetical protein